VKRHVTLAVTKINNQKREKDKDTGMNIQSEEVPTFRNVPLRLFGTEVPTQ
jgi:hypothetical protein